MSKSTATIMGYPVAAVLDAERIVERLKRCQSKEGVARVMVGVPITVFRFIDEKPGYFPGNYNTEDWYRWLRQLRNDPESKLFDHLT
jgi:hypothetical protein